MKPKDFLSPIKRFTADRVAGPLQVTLDPKTPGVTRIHFNPLADQLPETQSKHGVDQWLADVYDRSTWADLLRAFIEVLNGRSRTGQAAVPDRADPILDAVVEQMHELYPSVPREVLLADLNEIVALCIAVSHGAEVPPEIQQEVSWQELARHMKAPQRMNLLVSPMIEGGEWVCPLHCKGCYATSNRACASMWPFQSKNGKPSSINVVKPASRS